MACNISSAVAIEEARRRYPELPILGVIEPGASAALASGAKRIGVLATQGTVTSGAYTRVIRALSRESSVTEIPCPLFVPIVEAEETKTDRAMEASKSYLGPLVEAESQTIILGCTHYPFLQQTLNKAASALFPANSLPTFIDPAIETANVAHECLCRREALNPSSEHGRRSYFVSGQPDQFQNSGSFFLGEQIVNVDRIILD